MRCKIGLFIALLGTSAAFEAFAQSAPLPMNPVGPAISSGNAASPAPGDPHDAGNAGRPGGFRHGALFISPAGKPFRAQPGDPYPVVAWFSEADTDHDGKLTIGEMRDDASRFFAELDTNHDGEIDPDEVTHYETVVVPEVQSGDSGGGGRGGNSKGTGRGGHGGHGGHGGGHGGGMGAGGGGGGMSGGGMGGGGHGESDQSEESGSTSRPQATEGLSGAAFYSLIPLSEPVTSTDIDMNRVIRVEKFRAAAERHFHMLDTAGKGWLTLADLPKTPIQERGSGAKHRGRKH